MGTHTHTQMLRTQTHTHSKTMLKVEKVWTKETYLKAVICSREREDGLFTGFGDEDGGRGPI